MIQRQEKKNCFVDLNFLARDILKNIHKKFFVIVILEKFNKNSNKKK